MKEILDHQKFSRLRGLIIKIYILSCEIKGYFPFSRLFGMLQSFHFSDFLECYKEDLYNFYAFLTRLLQMSPAFKWIFIFQSLLFTFPMNFIKIFMTSHLHLWIFIFQLHSFTFPMHFIEIFIVIFMQIYMYDKIRYLLYDGSGLKISVHLYIVIMYQYNTAQGSRFWGLKAMLFSL